MRRILIFTIMVFFIGDVFAEPNLHQTEIKKVSVNGEHDYWYYRNSKVYFDKKNRVYFYRYKNRWRQGKRLPSWVRLDTYRVSIRMRTNRPYSQHSFHERRYPPKRVVFNDNQPRKRLKYPDQKNASAQTSASKPTDMPQNSGEAQMWYSPAKKVFYNKNTGEYAYLDRSWHWQRSKQLPANIKVNRYPKIPLRQGASMPKINERFNTRKVNMIVTQYRADKPTVNQEKTKIARSDQEISRSQTARVQSREDIPARRYPAGPNPGVKMYTYHFYPNSQVYHDPKRRIYFYLRGKRWVTNRDLPRRIKLKGDFVKLDSPQTIPYKMNRQHLKQYPPR